MTESMFTAEEIELLASAVARIPHPAYTSLSAKIQRIRLVGKRVRFLDDTGREAVGTLQGFPQWGGSMVAEVVSKGFMYRLNPATELLGEVPSPCDGEDGHDWDIDPEDIALHACTRPDCGAWYRS